MVGCVNAGPRPEAVPSTNVSVDVANASRSSMSPDLKRQSAAMHHFLVGQIALNEQDFKTALDNFSAADGLTDEPAPIIHTKLADLYLRFGELDKALAAASQAMQEDPSDPHPRLLHAGVLESLGRDSEAEPEYRKLMEEFPGKFDSYVLLANLYTKQQKYQQAIDVLTTLQKIEPSDSLSFYYLGRTYEQMGRFDRAEVEYQKVFESDPNLSNGAVELLRVLLRNKKTDKAKMLCERMLQKDPSNALARKVLGHLMLGESKLDEALKHLVVLEGLEGDASDTRFKIALIQMEKRNFDEAVRELSLVLATKPDHGEARYYLASIYAGSGKKKEALEELALVKQGDPMFVKSRTFAAFILRQGNELEKARDQLEEAREVEPDNKNLLLYYVLIMRDLEEYSEAEDLMRAALAKEPKDERLLFNLGLVLHERGNSEEALSLMEQVISLNPRNSDALNYLAYGLAQLDRDLPRAQGLVTKALEIRGNDPFYLDTLGWIQFKRGLIKESEETLAKAVSLAGEDLVIVEHYIEVLVASGKEDKAVSIMKAVVEQDLTKDGAADSDTRKAYERIRERLRKLLKEKPHLANVEKSVLNKRTPPATQQTSFDVELLTDAKP
jgi:tetratricopeptide (TPR) repeat protein